MLGTTVGIPVSTAVGLTLTLGTTLGNDHGTISGSIVLVGAALDAPYGIAVGFRQSVALRSRPVFDSSTSSVPGRYVSLVGQDFTDVFDATIVQYDGVDGDIIVDHAVVSVYPHDGAFTVYSNDFYGALEGTTVVTGDAEGQ